jgi:two-component system OmpR family response regulator
MTELNSILYVEDDPDIREVALMSLETLGGFTVHPCGSGNDALKLLQAQKPQLALLDVMMPGMDGPSTLRAMREKGQDMPVIFMTAKVQKNEVEAYMALGALGVIDKPFDPMALPDQIRALWSQRKVT